MLNRVFQMAKRRQQIGQFLKTRASKSGILISSRTRRERAREGESKSSEVRPKLQLPYKSAKATIRKGLRRKYTKVPVLMFLCFTRCFHIINIIKQLSKPRSLKKSELYLVLCLYNCFEPLLERQYMFHGLYMQFHVEFC